MQKQLWLVECALGTSKLPLDGLPTKQMFGYSDHVPNGKVLVDEWKNNFKELSF